MLTEKHVVYCNYYIRETEPGKRTHKWRETAQKSNLAQFIWNNKEKYREIIMYLCVVSE